MVLVRDHLFKIPYVGNFEEMGNIQGPPIQNTNKNKRSWFYFQAVKLESARAGRTRYLVVVSRSIRQRRKSQSFTARPATATSSIREDVSSDISKGSERLSQKEVENTAIHIPETSQDDLRETKMTGAPNGRSERTTENTSDKMEMNASKSCNEGSNIGPSLGTECEGRGASSEEMDRRMSTDCGYDTTEEDQEESCLLGIDCNEQSTVGLVLRIYAATKIHLDGDGWVLIFWRLGG